jgi:hypothetical protein
MLSEKLITMISGVITSWRLRRSGQAWPDVSGAIVGDAYPSKLTAGWRRILRTDRRRPSGNF